MSSNNKTKFYNDYRDLFNSQLASIEIVIQLGNIASIPAINHKNAINQINNGDIENAIQDLKLATKEYDKIQYAESTPRILKCKGDCILTQMLINYVFKDIYNIKDIDVKASEAFVFLWLSFELSHYTILDSLESISELFCLPSSISVSIEGFIGMTLPFQFSLVSEYLRYFYANMAISSLETSKYSYDGKWVISDFNSTNQIPNINNYFDGPGLSLEYYNRELDKANNRIIKFLSIQGKFSQEDISDILIDDFIEKSGLLKRFENMIRNIKKGSGHDELLLMFKNFPMNLDEAIRNENSYAIFTIVYSDMFEKELRKHNSNVGKTDTEVAAELHNIAVYFSKKEKYGTAIIILLEAHQFDKKNDNIVQLLLNCIPLL